MPLTVADNVLHQNSDGVSTSSTSTAITVALAGADATATDSVLIVALYCEGLTITTPAGWAPVSTFGGLVVFRRGPVEGLVASETSWDFTPTTTAGKAVVWQVFEFSDIDPAATVNVVEVAPTTSNAGQIYKTSSTPASGILDGMKVAFFAIRDSASTTIHTWDEHWNLYDPPPDQTNTTGPWDEVLEVGQAGTGNSVDLSCAMKPQTTASSAKCDGVPSVAMDATHPGTSIVFILRAIGAKTAVDMVSLDGAEHGVITGNTIGQTSYKVLTTATAGVTVDATAARSGSYGWLLTSSAAACNFTRDSIVAGQLAFRRAFRFPTLPGADLIFYSITPISPTGSTVNVRYINATGCIGVQVGTGTEQVSAEPIVENQWFALDIFHNVQVAGNDTTDWRLDVNAELTDTTPGIAQTQAVGSANSSSTSMAERVGWTAAGTATLHSDDGGAAPGYNYPIGDLRVLPLKVDPAGTATATNTSLFGVMTGNGSVAAWNATNFRNAMDDVPPDLSGTRDAGVATGASGGTAYAEVPMETRALAANRENARGAKFVGSIWAASATATTIKVDVTDGTTVYAVYPEGAPTGYGSSSPPAWVAKIIRGASNSRIDWTQEMVDNIGVRFGSADANPDIGFDLLLVELAVVKAYPEVLFGAPDEPIYVEAARDPDTNTLVGFTVTTLTGQTAEVTYEVDGVADTTGVIAADSVHYEACVSGAETGLETVSNITLIPGIPA